MICEMAAAVAAAVSELPRPDDVAAAAVTVDELDEDVVTDVDEDDDDDDDEDVAETLAGIRKPLTDRGFRLVVVVLLLLSAAIKLLLLLLLLALTDGEDEDEDASAATEPPAWMVPCPPGPTAPTSALTVGSSSTALPSAPFSDMTSWFMMISWHSGHRSCTYSHFRRHTPWK